MSLPPNTALYIKNLNDKVRKEELRTQLYSLFTPYGKVISVVAQKGPKMKGQAFVVFKDLAGATSALRSMDGEIFYDKQMHIEYARTKSWATMKTEDPSFIPPSFIRSTAAAAAVIAGSSKKTVVSTAQLENERKRGRDDDQAGSADKKRKDDDDDDDDMEMDEDDDAAPTAPTAQPAAPNPVSSTLKCENLPQVVTDDVLSVLFQQYPGFQSTHVSPVLDVHSKSKTAHVRFDSAEQATTALEALDGFTLKKGWNMKVVYA